MLESPINFLASRLRHRTRLTHDQEQLLILQAKQGNISAQNKLVEYHLRWVIKFATKYKCESVSLNDFINLGVIGLIKAIKKYDNTLNCSFLSYAQWWIRSEMQRQLAKSNIIHIPFNYISNPKNSSSLKFKSYVELAKSCSSLDYSINEDHVIKDFIIDDKSIEPDKQTANNILNKHIFKELDKYLTHNEKDVVIMHYGLLDGHSFTYTDVAKKYNISKETARLWHRKALEKLKQSDLLKSYLN